MARSQFDSARTLLEQASVIYHEAAGDSGNEPIYEKFLQAQNDYCDALRRKGAYDQALQTLSKNLAAALLRLGKMNAHVARTYDVLGVVHWHKGRFDQGLEYEKEAFAIRAKTLLANHVDFAKGYHNTALLYMAKGLLDSSLVLNQRALAIRLQTLGRYHFETAASYNNLGLIYQNKRDLENALPNYEHALEIALKLDNFYLAGNIYHNLARVHYDRDDFNKAIEVYRQSMARLTPIFGAQHYEIARSHMNLAAAYEEIPDYDNALRHLRTAINMLRQTVGDKHPDVGIAYNNLGNIHRAAYANYDSALFYYHKARQIALDAHKGQESPEAGRTLGNIGTTYFKRGEPQQAIKHHRQALDIFLNVSGRKSLEVGATYTSLGDAFLQQGRIEDALTFYQKALIALVYDFEDPSLAALPNLENVVSNSYLFEALNAKALALARRAQRAQSASPRVEDLKLVLACHEKNLELAGKMRRGFKTEATKLGQAASLTGTITSAIATALQLHQITHDEEYRHKAFRYSETGKALLLLEALQESNARKFAGIPDSMLQEERRLRLTVAYNRTQLWLQRTNRDSVKIAEWAERYAGESEKYETLLKRLEENYPNYYALKYRTEIASVAEARQALAANTALVEYFVGDSVIHIFTLTREEFEVTSVKKDSLLNKRVESLLAAVAKKRYHEYVQEAHQVFRTIVAPIADRIAGKNLLIIPDGVLNYVPFEALLVKEADAGSEDYRTLSYLIDSCSVSYAYSTSLWLEAKRRERRPPKSEFIAFAPVFPNGVRGQTRAAELLAANNSGDSTRASYSALPMTRDEVLSIKDLFAQNAGLATHWLGWLFNEGPRAYLEAEASEQRLKSESLADYRYVHFATHGFANHTAPDLSGLAFADDSTSSQEDGVLYLGEIYNLSFNAELVALSACETGAGKLLRGEGLLGLSRGFLYAGARNLLVSLWKVNDVSTARLMEKFYGNLLAGQSKTEALRQAKLHLMRARDVNSNFAQPHHWAPFVLIGE